MSIDVKTV